MAALAAALVTPLVTPLAFVVGRVLGVLGASVASALTGVVVKAVSRKTSKTVKRTEEECLQFRMVRKMVESAQMAWEAIEAEKIREVARPKILGVSKDTYEEFSLMLIKLMEHKADCLKDSESLLNTRAGTSLRHTAVEAECFEDFARLRGELLIFCITQMGIEDETALEIVGQPIAAYSIDALKAVEAYNATLK